MLAERMELGKRNTLSISDIEVEKSNLFEWDWEWWQTETGYTVVKILKVDKSLLCSFLTEFTFAE